MFDFYERRKFKRVLYSKGITALLVVLVMFLGYQALGVYQKEKIARERHSKSSAVLRGLEKREEALREEIGRLSTERGIEEEIRGKFEVSRDGEGVIVIVDPSDEENRDSDNGTGLFSRFLDLF